MGIKDTVRSSPNLNAKITILLLSIAPSRSSSRPPHIQKFTSNVTKNHHQPFTTLFLPNHSTAYNEGKRAYTNKTAAEQKKN